MSANISPILIENEITLFLGKPISPFTTRIISYISNNNVNRVKISLHFFFINNLKILQVKSIIISLINAIYSEYNINIQTV